MSETLDEIMTQIFSPELGWSQTDQEVLNYCPSYSDLEALASLLKDEPREEDLQQFLENYPQFLMGICGWGYDAPLAFLVKPSVGTSFNADLAVLAYGQGGCRIYSVSRPSEVQIEI